MPSVGVRPEPSARLEEVPVCVDNVAGARPAAQQRFMCHADEDMARGILIADEEPSGDQRLDESRSCRRARDFGEQGRTCRDRFIARTHRGEGAQHRRQCLLDVGRERVDDFIGAARDRPFEAAKRTIRAKVRTRRSRPASYSASSTNSRSGNDPGSAAAASCSTSSSRPRSALSSKRSPAARAGSRMIWAISGPVGGKSS